MVHRFNLSEWALAHQSLRARLIQDIAAEGRDD